MDRFRKDVMSALQGTVKEPEKVSEKEDYLVRVEIPDLNIRTGPGTHFARTGKYTGVGTFTIVEETDGLGAEKWGKLKSGAGWIALDYTERVA